MKSADVFIRELEEQKCFARLPQIETDAPTLPVTLPAEVSLGLDLGWLMAPIAAESIWASSWAAMCPPTSQRSHVEYLFSRSSAANWLLKTGPASDVIAVAFGIDCARETLQLLGEQSDAWRQTLRFRTGRSLLYLFRHPGARLPARKAFGGGAVRIFSGPLINVPPSRIMGKLLSYRDPQARPLGMPDLSVLDQPRRVDGWDREF